MDREKRLREAFSFHDEKGDGKLPASQVGNALRACGRKLTEEDVEEYVVQNTCSRLARSSVHHLHASHAYIHSHPYQSIDEQHTVSSTASRRTSTVAR
jgi:hypothetical protein